jgi:hypothetical protein
MNLRRWLLLMTLPLHALHGADLPDLASVPPDLTLPPVSRGAPAPGIRAVQTTAGWGKTQVHHLLYLPTDWQPGGSYPVIVEYAGNGNYRNKYGDISEGTVEGSRLGYGMTGGKRFLWLCLPYVQIKDGVKSNAITWWGDIAETKRYCLATVRDVCARFGGDADRVILCGFSRGAIACNYLGLHDDEIAALWRGFVCHSHYDGVREGWPYPQADRASALKRLQRLKGRPQFITHEASTAATEAYLETTGIKGDFTFLPIPFRNHSDAWVLRDLPERRQLRAWLARVVAGG